MSGKENQKKYQKQWYQENKERLKEKRKKQHKNWIENNRDKVNSIAKRYYDKNKKMILKKAKENIEYKKRQKVGNRRKRKEQPWLNHLYNARTRCNNPNNSDYKNYGGREIQCFLTNEDIKFLWFRDEAWKLNKPSIDREDNNWHYELSNCRFIEHIDNIKKSNLDRRFKSTLDYTI